MAYGSWLRARAFNDSHQPLAISPESFLDTNGFEVRAGFLLDVLVQ
jgi:hypothetical protein